MNQLIAWLSQLFSSWKFWIVVPPWCLGVRVRLGRIAATLPPGPHLRIPGLDQIALCNTRLRTFGVPSVTLPGSNGGRTRTLSAAVGFRVDDPVKSMLAYSAPEAAIAAATQAYLTEANGSSSVAGLRAALCAEVGPNGVGIEFCYLTENVEVRTLRLLTGNSSGYFSGHEAPQPVGGPGLLPFI